MNISNLILKRKSCRAYTQQPVDLEIVRSLLETAKWVPSGVNHQPTRVAVLGPETRARLLKALIEKFDQVCGKPRIMNIVRIVGLKFTKTVAKLAEELYTNLCRFP